MVRTGKGTKREQLIRLIHVGKNKVGLSEADYRAVLHGSSGKRSCADMTVKELEAVLKAIKSLGFRVKKRLPASAAEAGRATLEQITYIKGLWELCARVKTESALNAFVKRITGVPFLRWLDVYSAQKVILAVREMAAQAGYNPDSVAGA